MIFTYFSRALAIAALTLGMASVSLATEVTVKCKPVVSSTSSFCSIGSVSHVFGSNPTWTFINAGTNRGENCDEFEAVITAIHGSVTITATTHGSWQGNPAQWVSTPDASKVYTHDDLANGPLVFKFKNACGPTSNNPNNTNNQVELQFTEQPAQN